MHVATELQPAQQSHLDVCLSVCFRTAMNFEPSSDRAHSLGVQRVMLKEKDVSCQVVS